jgi:hypothetical protein
MGCKLGCQLLPNLQERVACLESCHDRFGFLQPADHLGQFVTTFNVVVVLLLALGDELERFALADV